MIDIHRWRNLNREACRANFVGVMEAEKVFQLLAIPLAIAAVYFVWADNFDWAFAFVVFAVCSGFLSYRFRLKERVSGRD
jgi:hypothetical protein